MNFKRFHESKNLFDISKVESNSGITNNGDGTLTVSGYPVNASANLGVLCPSLQAGDTVTLKFNTTSTSNLILVRYYDSGGLKWTEDWYSGTSKTITAEWLNARVGFYKKASAQGGGDATISNIMLNTGSTPQPYEPYSLEVWHNIPYYIHNTATDTLTTLPADIYANDTTATVGLKGNMSQQSGTTTVPSKSVTVSNLESGTNYALFHKADFPNAVVGDTINIVVSDTSYSQKVMKIDASYVYIENRTV